MNKKIMDGYSIELAREIRKLLMNALNQRGWYFFRNSRLCKCWEEMNCSNSDCPSYKSSNLRCWQVAGTFCKGKPQGVFVKKFGNCHKCKVYKKATGGSVILQIGEDFNNLMFHLKNKEDELRLNIENSEEKNRTLAALNEKINKLVEKLDKKNTLLRELSIKDGLTGLYNYRFFREILHEQFNLAKRFKFSLSCIMIDIDYFKAVNDTYGHQLGDSILSQLADILRNNVRDADKVVRYGGEEFVIILPYTDSEDAFIKAERLRKLVSDSSFAIGNKTIGITVSLGISTYPGIKNIKRADHLVSCADKALYQAKQRGRNRTIIYYGSSANKKGIRKFDNIGDVIERRKVPRIQTIIKIKGSINKKEAFSGNTFDISFSGLSFLSSKSIEGNKVLNIKLFLPAIDGIMKKPRRIDVNGLAVWCKQIGYIQVKQAGRKKQPGANYLIGVQFSNISGKDSVYLQKYFVSMFKTASRS